MGTVAAPILAGFAVAGTLELLSSSYRSRWPELTLLLLLVAAATLVASMQFAFRSRQFVVTPTELEAWWPAADDWQVELMRREQREHASLHLRWAQRARLTYNAGLLCFILGIGAALVPEGEVPSGRVLVLAVVALAFGGELTWILHGHLRRRASDP
jgi:hypothetical protein